MRKILVLFALVILMTASGNTPQEKYIEKYADIAVSEMYRSGVPASITLAQGLLESRYGESELALKSNNHFGIKCHKDWTGKKVYYDDDAKGECFRSYPSVADSYADHSDFLRYKDRYKFLFDYKITDYKAWCYGLKKAGYATDPSYATKLIKVIEDWKLYEYDTKKPEAKPAVKDKKSKKRQKVEIYDSQDDVESMEVRDMPDDDVEVEVELPQSPLKLEEAQKYEPAKGEFAFSLSRPTYKKNGVLFVYAQEGESYATIAQDYDLFYKEILKFNDLSHSRPLNPDDVVYIQRKKANTKKGLDMHIVNSGETLWDISQRYGVRMKNILKLNGLASANTQITEGDRILLR